MDVCIQTHVNVQTNGGEVHLNLPSMCERVWIWVERSCQNSLAGITGSCTPSEAPPLTMCSLGARPDAAPLGPDPSPG